MNFENSKLEYFNFNIFQRSYNFVTAKKNAFMKYMFSSALSIKVKLLDHALTKNNFFFWEWLKIHF